MHANPFRRAVETGRAAGLPEVGQVHELVVGAADAEAVEHEGGCRWAWFTNVPRDQGEGVVWTLN